MSECSSCGSGVRAGDRFCPSCGREITAAPVPTPPPVPTAAPAPIPPPDPTPPPAAARTPRSGLGKALLAGCGCLVLLALGAVVLFLAVFQLSGDATEAAREHIELIGSGEVDQAYESTSAALREMVSLESYRELVEARPVLRRVRDVSFPERSVEAGVATITARLEDDSGRSFDVPMKLREEGDEWLLIAIDWSDIPAEPGEPQAAAPPAPRARAAEARPAAPPPTRAVPSNGPSVGAVAIGSGRDGSGGLIGPGQPVSKTARQLSADIELVDHPRGGRVHIWIERAETGDRTEPVEATVEGEGSGTVTFNLDLGGEGLPPGEYRLVVRLGEDGRSETVFRAQ